MSIDAGAITAISNLALRAGEVQVVNKDAGIFAIPNGLKVENLEQFESTPKRVMVSPTHICADSFCEYVNRFKTTETIINGSLSKGSFTAHIQYHSAQNDPSWDSHLPSLKLTKTNEYEKMLAFNKKPLSQEEFADVIRELDHCITDPEGADLIELVLKIEAQKTVKFERGVDRKTGSISFTYKDETETKGNIKFPDKIGFFVAPYEASDNMVIVADILYKITNEGELKLRFEISQLDRVSRDAFDLVSDKIAQETDIKPYLLS